MPYLNCLTALNLGLGNEGLYLITQFSEALSPSIRTFNESEPLTTLDTCLLNLALHQQALRIVHGALSLPLDSDSSKTAFPWQASAGPGALHVLSRWPLLWDWPKVKEIRQATVKMFIPLLSTVGNKKVAICPISRVTRSLQWWPDMLDGPWTTSHIIQPSKSSVPESLASLN